MSRKKWKISRRQFLIGAGVTTGTVAVGIKLATPYGRLKLAEMLDNADAPGTVEATPDAWFEMSPENQIIIFIPKVEMGQGVHTSLAQIAAEELAVSWDQVIVRPSGTNSGVIDSFGTGASNSISSLFTPIREAAAAYRELLKAEAARQLGTTPDQVEAANGIFSHNGRSFTFAEIAAQNNEWEIPATMPPLKSKSEYQFIGQPIQRVDFPDKLTGRALYGYDMRLPNMLYGVVARPPTIEAKMKSAKPGTAADKAGVVQVVIEDDFAGVAAESRAQARSGVANMDIEWDEGKLWQQEELEQLVSVGEGKGVVIQKIGKADKELKNGTLITGEYRSPMAAHAHLEPQAALVDYQPDLVTAYVSTQNPILVRRDIAAALGMKEDEVIVHQTYLGGGFGRRLNGRVAVEAARLSRATGRPVHVGWSRSEEFRNGYLRPMTHSIFRAVLGENGKIHAIEHQQASGDVAFPFFPAIAASVMGVDFGAWRGGRFFYAAPHIRTVAWRVKMPVATGWWRGLGLLANTFAVESFIDELAHAANVDPLAFRLANLDPNDEVNNRFRILLEKTAARANWGEPLPAGRALGLACCIDVNTVVVQIAEVSIVDGRPRVHKVTCGVDPGLLINPDGASAQTEGAIIMGLSSTLLEEATVTDGKITPTNFDKYPLLTMRDAPEMDIFFEESGDEPFGMGEPPIGPIAAAVGNAVFALTGKRLRRLPFRLS